MKREMNAMQLGNNYVFCAVNLMLYAAFFTVNLIRIC